MVKSDDPEYVANILDRLDISIDDVLSKRTFNNKLNEIMQDSFGVNATQTQKDVFFPIAESKFLDFPNSDIKRVSFTRIGRQTTRFVLPGRRGLFGFAKAFEFYKSL